ERLDSLLKACLLHHLVERQPLVLHVALDELPVLHEDDGFPLDHVTNPRPPKRDVLGEHREEADRSRREDDSRDRVVAPRDPVLHECAENDVHQGKIVILQWMVRIGVSSSSSSTFCDLRPTFVGLTCKDMKKMSDCPAGMCPNPYASRPLRSVSVRGCGASPLTV